MNMGIFHFIENRTKLNIQIINAIYQLWYENREILWDHFEENFVLIFK